MFRLVILRTFPPMGVYETLFRFADATDTYMGDAGTHPWAQGFPITIPVPGGPSFRTRSPSRRAIGCTRRRMDSRRCAPRSPLTTTSSTTPGSRRTTSPCSPADVPAIFAILVFLLEDVKVCVEETEYTPYYDLCECSVAITC